MSAQTHFTTEQARVSGEQPGIDWSRFDVEQDRMGLSADGTRSEFVDGGCYSAFGSCCTL
jgi:hypothetical protein